MHQFKYCYGTESSLYVRKPGLCTQIIRTNSYYSMYVSPLLFKILIIYN